MLDPLKFKQFAFQEDSEVLLRFVFGPSVTTRARRLLLRVSGESRFFIVLPASVFGLAEGPWVHVLNRISRWDDETLAEWSKKNLDRHHIALCNVDDVINLRDIYVDQPRGEVMRIAMKLLGGYTLNLECYHTGQQLIDIDVGSTPLRPDAPIVFRLLPG